jgi:NADH-quinone oxidoreductase subunit L
VFHLTDTERGGIYQLLYHAAMFTAFLTAFYTFRAFFMTFYGEQRVPHEAGSHAHESPPSMWVPLALLAGCAALVGLCFDRSYLDGTHVIADFLKHAPSLAAGPVASTAQPGVFHTSVAVLSSFIAIVGIGIAAYLYLGDPSEVQWLTRLMKFEWVGRLADVQWVAGLKRLRPIAAIDNAAKRAGLGWLAAIVGYLVSLVLLILAVPLLLLSFLSPYGLSYRKFYFDEIYDVLVVWPLRGLAAISFWIDRWIIDGLVNLCGRVPPAIGSLMRSLQMGLVPFYALAMVLGTLILIAAKILWAGP